MDARREREATPRKNDTTVERTSERELVTTRTFNAPARIVFEAWTKPELFQRWWLPKSLGMSLRSCEMDVRAGGKYRLVFEPDGMAFFGTYLEVTPQSRLVWTNEEGGESGPVTTVTFEEKGGKTLLVMRELYPSKEALDAAGTGAADALVETFAQLDELLFTLGASVAPSR
ncbi:MAG TPA: SRPBCC domain-containing protein [Terriglobales bacterium]|nr:SRPBCC domain-containing protein [Terriglobales bacterium]